MSDSDGEEEKDEDMGDGEDEEVDDELSEFKQKIVSILEDNKMIKKRSSKMDTTDFLQLLSVFNEKDIHFR